MFDDLTPRYLPDEFWIASGSVLGQYPVTGTTFYPAGVDRPGSPIRGDIGALHVRTTGGDRWFGCADAYINSELRMVVIGVDSRDEVRAKWEKVPEDRQDRTRDYVPRR